MGMLTRQHLPLSRAPMTNQSSVPPKFTLGTNELTALTGAQRTLTQSHGKVYTQRGWWLLNSYRWLHRWILFPSPSSAYPLALPRGLEAMCNLGQSCIQLFGRCGWILG